MDVKSRRRPKTKFIARDLLYLSDACMDGRRYELIEGKLYEMPPPGARHGELTMTIGELLRTYVRQHRLGRVLVGDPGFVLRRNPDTVRGPDVAYISYQRFPQGQLPDGYLDLAPDLAVEVVSPGDRPTHVQEKVQEWLGAGVQVVWVVNPRNSSVTTYRSEAEPVALTGGDVLYGAPALLDFSCRVSDLFEQ